MYEAVIIGSGFGGQTAAIGLLRQGVDDFVLLERSTVPGGTWVQNRYPGAAVDVPSPLYSIASEQRSWTQMYASQSELERYTQSVIDGNGLRDRIVVDTVVEAARWDEEGRCWELQTSGGVVWARIVINATGPLSTPVVPRFEGAESFAGAAFHTNDWDHRVELSGKRVALVGSGASAAQVIPAIAADVAQLIVFQRTPHWVLPRGDRRFSAPERWLLGLRPARSILRTAIYWRLESRIIGFKYSRRLLERVALAASLRHLAKGVPDPELRAQLTPDYAIGCKRIILSDTLYPALCRPNVRLLDRRSAIESIDASGAWTTDGEHVPIDVLVYATGYDATDGLVSYPVRGRREVTLADVWSEYPRAYLGTMVPGFPNFFVVTGPNTGIGHTSAIFMIEAQMRYIMRAVRWARERPAGAVEVTAQAEQRYTEMIHREMAKTVWATGGCDSWYKSRSGRVTAMFPGFSFTYRRLTARGRRQDHVIT